MKAIKKIFHWIVEIEGFVALALLVVTISLNAYEIFQRNVFKTSFIWLQEYSTLMLMWFAMLGMCKIVYEKQDICVDLFLKKFPAPLQKTVQILTHLVTIGFMSVAIYETWILLGSQKNHYTLVAQYPLQWRSYALLISFVTICLLNLFFLVEDLIGLFRNEKGGVA